MGIIRIFLKKTYNMVKKYDLIRCNRENKTLIKVTFIFWYDLV